MAWTSWAGRTLPARRVAWISQRAIASSQRCAKRYDREADLRSPRFRYCALRPGCDRPRAARQHGWDDHQSNWAATVGHRQAAQRQPWFTEVVVRHIFIALAAGLVALVASGLVVLAGPPVFCAVERTA